MSRNQQSSEELRSFLRERRSTLCPRDVNLPAGKRTGASLSQEQVAELIGISRQWYIAFENGQVPRPTLSLVRRVAEALRMGPAELDRLLILASAHELPAAAAYVASKRNGALDAAYAIRNLARRCASTSNTIDLGILAAEAVASATAPSFVYVGSVDTPSVSMTFEQGTGAMEKFVGKLEPQDNDYCNRFMVGGTTPVESLRQSGVLRWVDIAATAGVRSFMATTICHNEKPLATFGIAHDVEWAFSDYEIAIAEAARAIAELTLH